MVPVDEVLEVLCRVLPRIVRCIVPSLFALFLTKWLHRFLKVRHGVSRFAT